MLCQPFTKLSMLIQHQSVSQKSFYCLSNDQTLQHREHWKKLFAAIPIWRGFCLQSNSSVLLLFWSFWAAELRSKYNNTSNSNDNNRKCIQEACKFKHTANRSWLGNRIAAAITNLRTNKPISHIIIMHFESVKSEKKKHGQQKYNNRIEKWNVLSNAAVGPKEKITISFRNDLQM